MRRQSSLNAINASHVISAPPFDGLARGVRHPDDPLDRMLAQP